MGSKRGPSKRRLSSNSHLAPNKLSSLQFYRWPRSWNSSQGLRVLFLVGNMFHHNYKENIKKIKKDIVKLNKSVYDSMILNQQLRIRIVALLSTKEQSNELRVTFWSLVDRLGRL